MISNYDPETRLGARRSAGRGSPTSENAAPKEGIGGFGKRITVLLAEERAMIREGICALLNPDENIAVIGHAPDYDQVTPLAEKLRPDVVIIAFSMAVKNGMNALRNILGALCGARMLVLVPRDNNAFGEHMAAAGVAGYLSEEASAQALASAVREVHETNRSFPPGVGRRSEICSPRFHGSGAGDKIIAHLTPRELEVLCLIAEGNANKQTAAKLDISIKTVEKHRQSLMDKLHIHDTASLTRYALHSGIAR